jgi:hypothetical protein
MKELIIKHAIDNIWCSPEQDYNYIFKLAKLTCGNGVLNRYDLHWESMRLPVSNKYFHIYNIGQLSTSIVNMLNIDDTWISFSDIINQKNNLITLYTLDGLTLPRFESYYRVTKTNDVIIAILADTITDLGRNDIYLKTYSNAYFNNVNSGSVKLFTKGITVIKLSDISDLNNDASKYISTNIYYYINGKLNSKIHAGNTVIGDKIEYVYDSSVKKIVDFNISTLHTFDSVLDNKGKYLLHYPKDDETLIDYVDDIDLYIIDRSSNVGLYINKNCQDTIRNVTHRDYSVVTSYVNNYFDKFTNDQSVPIDRYVLRLYIRHSGYSIPLILEKNRINELYKLNDDLILRSMVGLDSNIDIWKASALESSDYVRMMSSKYKDISNSEASKVYGYSSMVSIYGYTPKETILSNNREYRYVDVPVIYISSSTVFEFDKYGKLLGYSHNTNKKIYKCKYLDCVYVEMIYGKGNNVLNEKYGIDVVTDIGVPYKLYSCGKMNNLPDNNWVEIDSIMHNTKYYAVRYSDTFLIYEEAISVTNGMYSIKIIYDQVVNDLISKRYMVIPMGDIDIYLNGNKLILGLDYSFNNPDILIFNKSYLTEGKQSILLRFTGYCTSGMELSILPEYGFIRNGRISDNHLYKIKDDKILSISIDGKLKLNKQVSYIEDHPYGNVVEADNGKPYSIKHLNVPLYDITDLDTHTLLAEEYVLDEKISKYIQYNTYSDNRKLNISNTKHILYSPFLSRILSDLMEDMIDETILMNRYDDEYIYNYCNRYNYILKDDPIKESFNILNDHVIIHPHAYSYIVEIELHKFKFFSRVIYLYCKDTVSINDHVRLK